MLKSLTLGVIIGARGFFPGHLCKKGRDTLLSVLKRFGIRAVILPASFGGKAGAVENFEGARACAELFRSKAGGIDGILVSLPNFGDERSIAEAIRASGLDVPVLVHAWPDDPDAMGAAVRRDSFCGKLSCCNALRQYGIRYSLTTLHTEDPQSEDFAYDLLRFGEICRVVRGMRGLRIGLVGARPADFTTVRFSGKILEAAGISVEPIDLSEIIAASRKQGDNDAAVKAKLDELRAIPCGKTPADALLRMAKMGVAIDTWMASRALDASAIQCWTAIEELYGIAPCALMSVMSEKLLPSACECDVGGVLGMAALQFASGTPSALLDWNNNYGDDPDMGVFFHCSNLPRSFMEDPEMGVHAILSGTVGKENACGTVCGRIRPGPFTFLRLGTDDVAGRIRGYVGEGLFTDDPLDTFGGYGVFEISGLQGLLAYLCENGFEHHVAASLSEVADSVSEALAKYLGWSIHVHDGPSASCFDCEALADFMDPGGEP